MTNPNVARRTHAMRYRAASSDSPFACGNCGRGAQVGRQSGEKPARERAECRRGADTRGVAPPHAGSSAVQRRTSAATTWHGKGSRVRDYYIYVRGQ